MQPTEPPEEPSSRLVRVLAWGAGAVVLLLLIAILQTGRL